jgi:PilZ domain
MRIARTNFDRQESRRDRRYALPTLTIAIGDQDYPSDNWSLGGFQLSAPLALTVGDVVTGTLRLEGGEPLAFTALVVRQDEPAGSFGFRFQELSPLAVTMLDRALARRLVSRRRP